MQTAPLRDRPASFVVGGQPYMNGTMPLVASGAHRFRSGDESDSPELIEFSSVHRHQSAGTDHQRRGTQTSRRACALRMADLAGHAVRPFSPGPLDWRLASQLCRRGSDYPIQDRICLAQHPRRNLEQRRAVLQSQSEHRQSNRHGHRVASRQPDLPRCRPSVRADPARLRRQIGPAHAERHGLTRR